MTISRIHRLCERRTSQGIWFGARPECVLTIGTHLYGHATTKRSQPRKDTIWSKHDISELCIKAPRTLTHRIDSHSTHSNFICSASHTAHLGSPGNIRHKTWTFGFHCKHTPALPPYTCGELQRRAGLLFYNSQNKSNFWACRHLAIFPARGSI